MASFVLRQGPANAVEMSHCLRPICPVQRQRGYPAVVSEAGEQDPFSQQPIRQVDLVASRRVVYGEVVAGPGVDVGAVTA
jgi:hypothetical protein